MALKELTIEGEIDRVQVAIDRLKTFEPPEGYYLAFSGGKDSIVIYKLAKMAAVKFDTHFNFTSVDPPEILRFIRENYPDCIWNKPEKTMWKLIEDKIFPPTRIARYCCEYLKERGGKNRTVVLGVRRAESAKRSKRGIVEACKKQHKILICPIVDWSDIDVWDFIHQQELKYCRLYDEGYTRIGCVLCPMQTKKGKLMDVKRYPGFYKAYLKAFGKMIEERNRRGLITDRWKTAEEVMDWWINEPSKQLQDTLFN